ncbi:ATP-dependent Clp protease ATP-binding subunit clpA-like [Durusdinium trenchii]|uniref:ATP-dependent Clp protease ATP-binding subunit clpA-like n=1 Tax=Durusdinium trenchii TaxID=1381693 RepID=A0ABP0PG90_9DINO
MSGTSLCKAPPTQPEAGIVKVLTPAAWLDFTSHIESMLAAGKRDSALVLWESVVEIFHALKDTFVELGVMRPHAVMNERTQKEWERALMRLAEEKTTHSEPSTILNAVKTWVELRTFMKARDRTVVEAVDLAAFIQDGTPGPSRALNALRWLSKAGSLQFNLTNIVLPTPKSNRQRKKQQAIVVEPPMLPFLEQAIAQCWEQSNPKWSALLSSWLIAVGVMRHQHLLRSEPVRLSRSTLHLWCEKGKQSSKRAAFHGRSQHTSPTALVGLQQCAGEAGGYPLASVSLAASSSALMVSDGHFLNANDAAKSCLKDMRKTPRISLRTPGAGWGRPLARSEGWDRSSIPDPAAMPVHYSGGKKATSMRVKHLAYQLGASLREHQSLDVITPSELEEAKAFVMPTVDRLVSQDMDTEWQGKLPAEQAKRPGSPPEQPRAAAKGLLPLAQEPAVPTEAPAEPAEEPQEEPDYDPPSETESEDLTVVAPAEVKAAPKPPSPPAGEIIKGIPPAAAKGRKRSAEQVAPAAPAKKVKESPVPAPATPAAEPSPAPPSATEETRFAMPPIPASFTAATEDQQWDRLATGAAGGGTLCRAVMLSEPWEESARWLKTQRDTDLPGLMRDQKHQYGSGEPLASAYMATERSSLRVQGFTSVPLCFHKQGADRAKRLTDPMTTTDILEAIAILAPTVIRSGSDAAWWRGTPLFIIAGWSERPPCGREILGGRANAYGRPGAQYLDQSSSERAGGLSREWESAPFPRGDPKEPWRTGFNQVRRSA